MFLGSKASEVENQGAPLLLPRANSSHTLSKTNAAKRNTLDDGFLARSAPVYAMRRNVYAVLFFVAGLAVAVGGSHIAQS
jgi:hypothetical protein